jgi:membrane protease YdiL (CAAX protease family)
MTVSSLRSVLLTLPVAFGLWFFVFALAIGNFWLKLSFSALLLALVGLKLSRNRASTLFSFKKRHLLVGLVSAFLLYGIFWLGKEVSTILFPFASKEISIIYYNKAQLNLTLIGLLLLFIIGPAEEIYWHGFVQRSVSRHLGPTSGILITSVVYALVHIFALNLMLFLAAGVCGLFWGWLYQREQSLMPVILSHSLWDLSIFVLFPLR